MMSQITIIIALCVLLSEARNFNEVKGTFWNKIEENIEASKTKDELYKSVEFSTRSIGFDDDREAQLISRIQTLKNLPPAVMARYVVNQADWGAVATISTRKDVASFPVANLISIADGPIGNGNGIPYMYLTPLDFTAQDLAKDHRATVFVSLAQGDYCKNKGYDPMDPRCARVLLTGKIKAVKNESNEVVKQLFFGRHPKLQNMPADHDFFFAELDISTIALLDNFGGPKYISVDDYLNTPTIRRNDLRRRRVIFKSVV
ncbi:PREDICTED: protein CREG1 [Cyphomyrmex costatus]|uniref:Protein CREG1 n=1 Tax=Cyphomyrmex costatus TaxID=456900 RepID=A0A195CGG9_9HYME|nr:PREDICTED: protein CREG1 [Cyphomyrmex costatus]KYM99830.1 Protein CREG1 [Cyphomyrmex costatus]